MIDNIKELVQNEYRLGDIFFLSQGKMKKEFIDNQIYKSFDEKSIGYMYLDLCKEKHNIKPVEKITILSSIVRNKVKTISNTDTPKKDELVIHLRLGDVMTFPLSTNDRTFNTIIKTRFPNLDYLLEEIKKSNKTNITIVTAFHYRISTHNRNKTRKLYHHEKDNFYSKKFLEMFLDKIPSRFNVTIRSNNDIDSDFLYLCQADELLLSSGSMFAVFAKNINIYLKNPEKIQTIDDLYHFPNIENKLFDEKVEIFIKNWNTQLQNKNTIVKFS